MALMLFRQCMIILLLMMRCSNAIVVPFAPYASASLGNPFIGFVPYYFEDADASASYGGRLAAPAPLFPHSMENTYIPWSAIENIVPGAYNWTFLDGILDHAFARQNQLIFRVYADYPGNSPAYAVPEWLRDGLGTCNYTEDGGGISPDYDNSTLVDAMVNLIAAMGARYDGDVRVAFVQIGFLGHWGEWHDETCPFASPATQARVLLAFNASFTRTRLLMRYADVNGGLNVSQLSIGFHDDSFAQDTIGPQSWQFLQREVTAHATQQWQTAPIGGELRPELQLCIFAADPSSACVGTGVTPQDFSQCVQQSHASWQWDYSAFSSSGYNASNGDLTRALNGAASMGYAFTVANVTIVAASPTGTYAVTWLLQNLGAAPVYYPVNAAMLVVDAAGPRTVALDASAAFTSLLPGDSLTAGTSSVALSLPAQIGLQLSSPMALRSIAPTNAGLDSNGTLWTTVNTV